MKEYRQENNATQETQHHSDTESPNSVSPVLNRSNQATDSLANNETTALEASSLPQGYVAVAVILAPTSAEGITPVQLIHGAGPFDIFHALSMQTFGIDDVGKEVACVPMAHSEQLMIMGKMYSGNSANTAKAHSLDTILSHANTTAHAEASAADSAVSEGTDQQHLDAFLDVASNGKDDEDLELFTQTESVFETDASTSKPENIVLVSTPGEAPRQLVLSASEEITLKCGASYLTLKADGRIKINGKYIHSRASNVQRLNGGALKFN